MLNASKTNKTPNKKEQGVDKSHVKIIFDAKQRRLYMPTTKMCIGRVGTHTARKTSLINNSSLMHSTSILQASLLGYRDINIKDSLGE